MFGWFSVAAARASRRKRSTKPGSPASGPVQDLDGDLAGEHGVLGAEDLAHAAGGDPLQHVVAAVEGHECPTACLT